MKPPILLTILLASAICLAQSPEIPKFDIADVHVSTKTSNAYAQTSPARNGRYEIKTASMLDLIRIAYGFAADKILGGPNWLEMDRFDVIAKLPPDSTPDTQKQMLQSLLEDRFKLVVRKESKALPTYALTVGKKPQIKQAEGTEETGCKPKTSTSASPVEGSIRLFTSNADGATTTIDLRKKTGTLASIALSAQLEIPTPDRAGQVQFSHSLSIRVHLWFTEAPRWLTEMLRWLINRRRSGSKI